MKHYENKVIHSRGEIDNIVCTVPENQKWHGTYRVYWEDIFVGLFEVIK